MSDKFSKPWTVLEGRKDGWMDGWMGGWVVGKAGLRIAYSNQKSNKVKNISTYYYSACTKSGCPGVRFMKNFHCKKSGQTKTRG